MLFTRGHFIAAAAAAAAVGATPAAFASDKSVKIAVGGKALYYYLPISLAESLGYFKDERLDVQIIDFQGGSRSLQAVVGGSADVVSGAFEHTLAMQARHQSLQAFVLQGRAPQCVFAVSNKPMPNYKTLTDLKGKKIRVQQTEVAISMVRALGAEATPMDYAEVFQGLQTGIVDGAENDFVSYYTSGHYEVAKYYSLDQHMAPPAVLLMSKASWDKMTEAQQEAVRKAAYEAAVWQRQAMQDYQLESRAACEAAGCEIIEVDVPSFQAAVASVYDEYPQYKTIVDMINAVE